MVDILNAAFFIAVQTGAAAIAWGGTGECKTAFLKALADALGYKFHHFIPSQHMPEDIGGMPWLDVEKGAARMFPMEWLLALTEPNWMLCVDEVTTAQQAMRPALLSALNPDERRVGSLKFHPTTIVCAAANPPELAPNSSPLEPSMLARFYHHNWELPFDSWLAGMMNGGNFPTPTNIPVVGDYSLYLPKWTRLIGTLLKAQPALRKTVKWPENEMAAPCLRQWHRLAHCLAGAEKVGADGSVMSELGNGMVGSAATSQLMQRVAVSDLHDPDAVLDGKEKVDYSEERLDQLIYLPIAMLDALRQNPADKRITKGCEVMIEMGENGMLDLTMPVLAEVSEVFPEYRIPKALLSRYGNLIKQIGGA